MLINRHERWIKPEVRFTSAMWGLKWKSDVTASSFHRRFASRALPTAKFPCKRPKKKTCHLIWPTPTDLSCQRAPKKKRQQHNLFEHAKWTGDPKTSKTSNIPHLAVGQKENPNGDHRCCSIFPFTNLGFFGVPGILWPATSWPAHTRRASSYFLRPRFCCWKLEELCQG